MKNHPLRLIFAISLTALTALPGISHALQSSDRTDIFEGYYAREGNNDTPTMTNKHNIYMKLYQGSSQGEGQWVAMLHIPLPYASSVDEAVLPKIFEKIHKMLSTSAFIRDDFGYLKEKATVQFERFGYIQEKLIFECGSLAPCSIIPADGYLELVKPGMINEHIIKYNHVVAK